MFMVGHTLMTTTNKYVRGQEEGARRMLNPGEFRGDTGEAELAGSSAKEGDRTLTGVTPPEPESGDATNKHGNSSAERGQEWTGSATIGPVSGDTPETQIPKSVAAASHWLAILRASDAALEGALDAYLAGLPRDTGRR